MSKVAVLFPGQGSQIAGMGKDFYEHSLIAREIFDTASKRLGLDLKTLCFEKNKNLDQTEYTQAALVTTCLAMARTAQAKGLKADVTAGLSLGEYSAIAFAGGMYDRDAIYIARQRGIYMEEAVPKGEGSMCAILGMSGEQVAEELQDISGVCIANYNCPGQVVISGITEDVTLAASLLKEKGAKRTLPLNVSGPFHSPMLMNAACRLDHVLSNIQMHSLQIPYMTNVTADYVKDSGKIPSFLVSQITSPVRWQQTMERMLTDGVDTFIEIGPGKTLTGFLQKMSRDVTCYHIGTWEELEQTMEMISKDVVLC